MFDIKNGELVISRKRKLSKKQEFSLNRLTGSDKERYLFSLLGLTKRSVTVPRHNAPYGKPDLLARKPPGLTIMQSQSAIDPGHSHVPLNIGLGNWVGVEIECFLPSDGGSECEYCSGSGRMDIPDEDGDSTGEDESCDNCGGTGRTTRRGTENPRAKLFRALRDAKITRVTLKEDGSLECEDGGIPVEVTMVYNSALGHGKLEQLLKVLNAAGAYVNSTCGLHVHLDMRQFRNSPNAVKVLGRRLARCLPVLAFMVPASRRDNHYCKLGMSDLRGERYYAVNLTAFNKFNTIEVRLHSGSVSFEKISNWVDLLKTIVASESITSPVNTFQDFIDKTNLPDRLVAYVEKRLAKHGPSMLVGTNTNGEVA